MFHNKRTVSVILFAILIVLCGQSWGTVKYVDLSLVSDSAANDPPHYWHTGASNDPFNHRNFRDWSCDMETYGVGKYYNGASWQTGINVKTDTFYIKGQMYAVDGALNNPFLAPDTNQVFLPWDPSTNGPYRITNWGGSISLQGRWYGGYIGKASLAVGGNNAGVFYGMILEGTTLSIAATNKFYECTIHASGGVYLSGKNDNLFINCILYVGGYIETCGDGFTLHAYNTVCNKSRAFWDCGYWAVDTNCQWSWGNFHTIAYNAPKDSFESSINLNGVSTPPRPGKTPYSYAYDLWGGTRYDIGANWQKAPIVSWDSPIIDSFGKSISHTMTTGVGPVDSVKAITTLPPGISLNTASGLISGTPSKVTFKSPYTLRAYGAGDSCTFVCTLSVIPKGPMRHYVNVSLPTDSATSDTVRFKHTGESDDPFNMRDFKEAMSHAEDTTPGRYYDFKWHEIYSSSDTFYIRGSVNNDSIPPYNNPGMTINFIGQVFLPWNSALYGPYRLYHASGTYRGTWKGGIIFNPGSLYGMFYNMNFGGNINPGDSATSMHIFEDAHLYGTTVECNEVWYHHSDTLPHCYMQDCIMRHPETSGPIPPEYLVIDAKNTVFRMTVAQMMNNGVWVDSNNVTDSLTCQFGNTSVKNPRWNMVQDSFHVDSTVIGVPLPPVPGKYRPYTGYETDLFGNARYDIGANWQPSPVNIDSTLMTHYFVQDDTVRTKFLRVHNHDSTIFNKPVFVRDSLVYFAGTKPRSITGAYVKSYPRCTLTVKLNGITGTPRVYADTGSRIRWR
jgi:hypothetical protein